MAQSVGTLATSFPTSHGNSQDVISRGVAVSSSFTLPTSSANAVVFKFAPYSGGMIKVSGACTITWYVGSSDTDTVAAAYDDASTPAALTQAPAGSGWYAIPAKLFAAGAIAPVSNTGSITATIVLKK